MDNVSLVNAHQAVVCESQLFPAQSGDGSPQTLQRTCCSATTDPELGDPSAAVPHSARQFHVHYQFLRGCNEGMEEIFPSSLFLQPAAKQEAALETYRRTDEQGGGASALKKKKECLLVNDKVATDYS